MNQHTKSENNGKGSLVEMLTKDSLSKLGFNIDTHYIYEGGCDATGTLANISVVLNV